MKGRHPHKVDALRADLVKDEAGMTEYMEQRVISQLGAIIERVIKQRQLSQSELARIAGMQQPDLNALIRGRTEHIPTVATLRRLSRALGTSLMVDIEPNGAVSIRQESSQRAEAHNYPADAAGAV